MFKLARFALPLIMFGVFFITGQASADSCDPAASQLAIVTTPQTIFAGEDSLPLKVQLQDNCGTGTQASSTVHLTLTSSSPTGEFSNATLDGSCTADSWSSSTPFTLTMNKGTTNKAFCYRDQSAGSHNLAVADGDGVLAPASQVIVIKRDKSTYALGPVEVADYFQILPLLAAGDETIGNRTIRPFTLNIDTQSLGDNGYSQVLIQPVNIANLQLWARDASGNWFDLSTTPWGGPTGSPLPADFHQGLTIFPVASVAGDYTVTLNLFDLSDGLTLSTVTIILHFVDDVTAPTVDWGPAMLPAGTFSTSTVLLSAVASDSEVGVRAVEFSFASTTSGPFESLGFGEPEDEGPAYTKSWDGLITLPAGDYYLLAVATDRSSNQASSSARLLTSKVPLLPIVIPDNPTPTTTPPVLIPPISTSSATYSKGSSLTLPSRGQVLGASTFHFTHFLELGMGDLEVWDLQWRLRAEGLYHGYITGYFSPATEVALRQYQLSHGLAITGYLDRQTRAEMN